MQYRHRFLAQLALLTLLLPFAAQAAGPNAAVTASRISGKVPLLVYFDATATTDSDLTKPIHHLTYCFDAGDGNTDSYSQAGHKTTQKAKFCGAPGWAYVYETIGTHTMTLTVIDEQGNTDTATVDITVNDWSAAETTCVSTSGNFTGCPFTTGQGATHITDSDFDANATNSNRVLFRCGENFATSATVSLGGGRMIGGYDNDGTVTNRRCRYNVTTGSPNPLIDVTGDDVRVMDGNDQAPTTGAFVQGDAAASDTDNMLVQNWNTSSNSWIFSLGANLQAGSALPTNIGFFSNNFSSCSSGASNCFYTAVEYLALVDNVLDGGIHTVRLVHGEDDFIHMNKFAGNNSTNHHMITVRGFYNNGTASGWLNRWAENVFISDNWFVAESAWPVQIGAEGGTAGGDFVRHRNHIVERNYFTSQNVVTQKYVIFMDDGDEEDMTFRYNLCDMTTTHTGADCISTQPTITRLEIYGNSQYSPDNGRGFADPISGCEEFHNNLSWDDSGLQLSYTSCTNASGNADADGGETGVANLAACPFAVCPPTTVEHFKVTASEPTRSQVVDAGVSVPYRCDFGQEDAPGNSLYDIGAYEEGTSTSVCGAAATVAQQPGQNHRINSVTP